MQNLAFSVDTTGKITSSFHTRSVDNDTCEFRELLESWGIYDEEAEYQAFKDMAEAEVRSDKMVLFRKAS